MRREIVFVGDAADAGVSRHHVVGQHHCLTTICIVDVHLTNFSVTRTLANLVARTDRVVNGTAFNGGVAGDAVDHHVLTTTEAVLHHVVADLDVLASEVDRAAVAVADIVSFNVAVSRVVDDANASTDDGVV